VQGGRGKERIGERKEEEERGRGSGVLINGK